MVTPRERAEYCRAHFRPTLEHLLVAEAKHAVAACAQSSISPAIVLKSLLVVVESAPVDLDHEALAKQEVDRADTGNCDLLARVNSEPTEPKQGDGFGD